MDELDALRGMRTALAQEEDADRLALRVDWRARPERPARPRRRSFTVPAVGLVATASVAAGALVVVSVAAEDERPANVSASPGGNALLVAAANAERAPGGRYWHTRTRSGEIYAVGDSRAHHYKVDSRQGAETWTDRNGSARTAHVELADVPLTAEDRRKWQAAGSPEWVKIPNPEGGPGPALLDMRTESEGREGWRPGEDDYLGMTRQQVAALPTRPDALLSHLLGLKGAWRAASSNTKKEPIGALRGEERIRALTDVAGMLLSTAPAPPRVRAAAFRMLADLPGVRPEGRATDPMGRPGTVVSLPLVTTVPLGLYTAPKQLGTYRRQWIIDPGSGRLLAIRDLVAKPPRGSRPLPPGDRGQSRRLEARDMPDRFHRPGELADYTVYETTEWTDKSPS
ncbi:CU044_5270 family protein [Actinomadura litoris]|uniref:CU044_5270 family protein n=1 Tax=Actinomadura litoris TaxID=2678616 RepID=UPI001FA7A1FA|nr:CU044_5270 family protein [Actinomadura litoris]